MSLNWSLEELHLPLRYTWKISRNATDFKTNLVVRVQEGALIGMGEAAPNVRYGETPELLKKQFEALQRAGLPQVKLEEELHELLAQVPVANALRFAVESAWVHLQSRKQGKTVAAYLAQPPVQPLQSCFSLPIMEPEQLPEFIEKLNLTRFPALKVKVNRELGATLVQEVARLTQLPLWIDGNEAFSDPDELLQVLEQVKNCKVQMVEQPLPAKLVQEYKYLKPLSPYPLFADESVTNEADFEEIAQQFHGVNMKLMKAGGYRRGIKILEQTRQHGLQPMIGCMVETSLGIWSALQVASGIAFADLDGFLIVQDEPFGLVQEENGNISMIKDK